MVKGKFKFTNSSQGFEEALEQARVETVKTGCRGVIFAIETASHYWRNFAYFLEERGIPFCLINQFTLKRRREGKDLNRRKNDFRDAEVAAQLLYYYIVVNSLRPNYHKPFMLNSVLPTTPIAGWVRIRRGSEIWSRAYWTDSSPSLPGSLKTPVVRQR